MRCDLPRSTAGIWRAHGYLACGVLLLWTGRHRLLTQFFAKFQGHQWYFSYAKIQRPVRDHVLRQRRQARHLPRGLIDYRRHLECRHRHRSSPRSPSRRLDRTTTYASHICWNILHWRHLPGLRGGHSHDAGWEVGKFEQHALQTHTDDVVGCWLA